MDFNRAYNLVFKREVLIEARLPELQTYKDATLASDTPIPVTDIPRFRVKKFAALSPDIQKIVINGVVSDLVEHMRTRGGTIPYIDYRNIIKKSLKKRAQAAMVESGMTPYPYAKFDVNEQQYGTLKPLLNHEEYQDLHKLLVIFDSLGIIKRNKYAITRDVLGNKTPAEIKETESNIQFSSARKYFVDYEKFTNISKRFRGYFEQPEIIEVLNSVLLNYDEQIVSGSDILKEITERFREIERERALYKKAAKGVEYDETELSEPEPEPTATPDEGSTVEPEEEEMQKIDVMEIMNFLVIRGVLNRRTHAVEREPSPEEMEEFLDNLKDLEQAGEEEDFSSYIPRGERSVRAVDYETPDITYET